MKQIILTLLIFFAVSTLAFSAEFYNCVDKNGNSFITDNPPQGAKCKATASDDESSTQNYDNANQSRQKDSEAQQAQQGDESQEKINRLKRINRGEASGAE